jgi:hypothetical protein
MNQLIEPKNKEALAPFTLDLLLGLSCSNPVDYDDWRAWNREEQQKQNLPDYDRERDYKSYSGWNQYSITLHCTEINVIARLTAEGKYEIREYLLKDH